MWRLCGMELLHSIRKIAGRTGPDGEWVRNTVVSTWDRHYLRYATYAIMRLSPHIRAITRLDAHALLTVLRFPDNDILR